MKVLITELHQDPSNARKHSKRSVEATKASLQRFGQQKPIVVGSDNVIIAGNSTWQAAKELGWKEIHINRSQLKGADRTAYAIADNRTAELSEWDDEILAQTMQALKDDPDIDELVAGFDQSELEEMLNADVEVEEDEVPEVDEGEPISKTGDLWVCGRHRVLCGDSACDLLIARFLLGVSCDLMLTDPPYGVGYQYDSIEDTKDNLIGLIDKVIKPMIDRCDVSLITPGNGNQYNYPIPLWTLSWQYFGVGRSTWGFTCWQPVLAYGKDPYLANKMGCRPDAINNLPNDKEQKELNHSCPKPIAIWSWILARGSVRKNDNVIDPFLGSGTTLIAAEQLGRTCYGIEISPKYVDVICKRYLNLTGESPIRDADGVKFTDLMTLD